MITETITILATMQVHQYVEVTYDDTKSDAKKEAAELACFEVNTESHFLWEPHADGWGKTEMDVTGWQD